MIDLNHCRKATWPIRLGLLLLTAPAAVQAQFSYATNNGAITLTEYTGAGGAVVISNFVTSIGQYAFQHCDSLSIVFFQGNAPTADSTVFYSSDTKPTGYYFPGTTGWSEFSANTGLPVVLWNPLIQASDANFGVRAGQFGFNLTGINNFTVVVAACTNLAGAVWVPLTTNTLVKGSFYFSDP